MAENGIMRVAIGSDTPASILKALIADMLTDGGHEVVDGAPTARRRPTIPTTRSRSPWPSATAAPTAG